MPVTGGVESQDGSISLEKSAQATNSGAPAAESAVARFPAPPLAVMAAYARLTRPRILVMVMFSMAAALWAVEEPIPSFAVAAHALFGTALVIAGALALNQRIEWNRDAVMQRTAKRPLPAGQVTEGQATCFGLLLSLGGMAYLATFSTWSLLALAATSWSIYLWAYTPLKAKTVWQTPVGAVAGAMPVLLGATTVDATFSPMALVLFGILYFWQFPHAMAIAWLYRRQFQAAGMQLATVVDPSGRSAGILAVAGAVILMPISLIPSMLEWTGWPYNLTALLLGHGYMATSFALLRRRDDRSAKWLLRMSLLYLPLLLIALLAS